MNPTCSSFFKLGLSLGEQLGFFRRFFASDGDSQLGQWIATSVVNEQSLQKVVSIWVVSSHKHNVLDVLMLPAATIYHWHEKTLKNMEKGGRSMNI